MARQVLKLGVALSEVLRGANTNFTELYGYVSELQEMLNDEGKTAVVFQNGVDFVNLMNEGIDDLGATLDLKVGDEIYILDPYTPDFWVTAVNGSSTNGAKPEATKQVTVTNEHTGESESLTVTDWGTAGTTYTFGVYTVAVANTDQIVLGNYLAKAELIAGDEETGTINYTVDAEDLPSDTAVSALALQKTLRKLMDDAGCIQTISLNGVENKLLIDENKNVNIDAVTGITLNGEPITVTNGVAEISIANLEGGYSDLIYSSDAAWVSDFTWTSHNSSGEEIQTVYPAALKVASNDTALEMINEDGETVITQNIVDTTNNLVYMCTNKAINCRLRQLSGLSAGGSGSGGDTTELENRLETLETNFIVHESGTVFYLYRIKATFEDADQDIGGVMYFVLPTKKMLSSSCSTWQNLLALENHNWESLCTYCFSSGYLYRPGENLYNFGYPILEVKSKSLGGTTTINYSSTTSTGGSHMDELTIDNTSINVTALPHMVRY